MAETSGPLLDRSVVLKRRRDGLLDSVGAREYRRSLPGHQPIGRRQAQKPHAEHHLRLHIVRPHQPASVTTSQAARSMQAITA